MDDLYENFLLLLFYLYLLIIIRFDYPFIMRMEGGEWGGEFIYTNYQGGIIKKGLLKIRRASKLLLSNHSWLDQVNVSHNVLWNMYIVSSNPSMACLINILSISSNWTNFLC